MRIYIGIAFQGQRDSVPLFRDSIPGYRDSVPNDRDSVLGVEKKCFQIRVLQAGFQR